MAQINNKMSPNAEEQKAIIFTEAEQLFLKQNEICRVATSHNDIPHVAPVNFIFDEAFYFATDYGTKKYKNIAKNKNVSLVIDIYKSSVDNKAVIIQGTAQIIEKGSEFKKLYDKFYQKFDWVREDPWQEGEAPFIKVVAKHKVSWGL
jgi:nitroimidazol reductase NimA-like FMN-containing flavoprotein (pyridoxamine 5'-phosphate oxidase superfamily)